MIENYYGYVKTESGIGRYIIRIQEDIVELTTVDRILRGKKEIRKTGNDNSEIILFNIETDDRKGKTVIMLKRGDSVENNVMLGVYSSFGFGNDNTVFAGRIILTKINLRPTKGSVISFKNVEGFFHFSKTEEWLSVPSILSYLQSGDSKPEDSEVEKLRKEVEEHKSKLEELRTKQNQIIEHLENEKRKNLHLRSIKEFKELIRTGEIDGLFSEIINWMEANSKKDLNEVLILNSQWSTIQKEFRLGLIQLEIRMLFQNKISVSLLQIIEKIENNTGWNNA